MVFSGCLECEPHSRDNFYNTGRKLPQTFVHIANLAMSQVPKSGFSWRYRRWRAIPCRWRRFFRFPALLPGPWKSRLSTGNSIRLVMRSDFRGSREDKTSVKST
jgi:hypothetical protein